MQKSIKKTHVTNFNAQRRINHHKIWREQDDLVLKLFFARESNELNDLLERFSPREIRNRAEHLGIKLRSYKDPICDRDKELCLDYKNDYSFKKLQSLNFQKGEIYQIAESLGAKEPIAPRGRATTWSEQEIEILHSDFPKYGADIKALKDLGRSYSAIMIKAEKEGLI